ncbi:MAG: hypothetical protein QOI41_2552 [Myxococcales bacterium]|nr:hypothetical protein [Myxococcales bacterium]
MSAPVAVQIPDARMLIATGDAGSPRATAACSRDPGLTPVDVPLFEEAAEALRSGDKKNFDVVPPKPAPPPPYTATLITPARERAGLGPRTTVRLAKASERKNGITDEAVWYRDNALFRPRYFLPSSRDYMFLELTIFEHDVAWPLFEAHTYASWQRDPSLMPESLPVTIPLGYGTLPLTTALSSGEYDHRADLRLDDVAPGPLRVAREIEESSDAAVAAKHREVRRQLPRGPAVGRDHSTR